MIAIRFALACSLASAAVAPAADLVLVNTAGKLTNPFAVAFGPQGEVYVVEMDKGERLCRIEADGRVTTLAGSGKKGLAGDDGPGTAAVFNGMHCLAAGPGGVLYLADTFNNCLRTYDPATGRVARFAGTGAKGFAGDDGPALDAKFGAFYSVAFDPKHTTLVMADLDNRRVRAIDVATGRVRTVAGNGAKGVPADGAKAMAQPLADPRAAAIGADGTIYIVERGGHALRAVKPDGTIRTVAGTGKAGSALGKTALACAMNGPKHVAVDRDGSVLIADSENHRVLRYRPEMETLELVAGSGQRGGAGLGGPAAKAELNRPHGVSVHPTTGEIYIADSENHRVVRLAK